MALIEKVAMAIRHKDHGLGYTTHYAQAHAAIAVVLRDQYKKMPKEMYGPPIYYLREYARKNGIDLNDK